ncbi:conserved hypothetical protein [Ricinus communis]|uniref:Uncharacterized protein n=1 Tax=Ricinus communis TaxID=3988 RepID=B9SIC7_RICCO|nr:conserved hypothetical protein [Ricinus communis]
MAKKAIQKAINNIKGLENKSYISSLECDNEIATFVSVLRESHPKPSSWTLVSKLMLHKRIASGEEEAVANEFSMTDAALESLMGCTKYDNMENVQSQLKNLEECIQDLEEGTHSLFRRMIKARVSLLNIFN